MHVCVLACMSASVCGGGGESEIDIRRSHSTLQSLSIEPQLASLFSQIVHRISSPPPECWDHSGLPHPPCIYIDTGDLNSGPHTCVVSTLPISLANLHLQNKQINMLATYLYIQSPNNYFLISPPIIVDLTYSQEATPRGALCPVLQLFSHSITNSFPFLGQHTQRHAGMF